MAVIVATGITAGGRILGKIACREAVRTAACSSQCVTLVQDDRSPVAVVLSDGSVRNAYTIKLLNKSATPHAFDFKAEGADAAMAIIGNEAGKPVIVPADGSEAIRVTLTMVRPQNTDVRFVTRDVAGKDVLSAVDRFLFNNAALQRMIARDFRCFFVMLV